MLTTTKNLILTKSIYEYNQIYTGYILTTPRMCRTGYQLANPAPAGMLPDYRICVYIYVEEAQRVDRFFILFGSLFFRNCDCFSKIQFYLTNIKDESIEGEGEGEGKWIEMVSP